MSIADQREQLRGRVAGIEWYHTIELAAGVVTPGWFDTRSIVERIGFPSDLSGKRCLDIGTFDGFWAFTMEQRGAAEVLAIDVPDPASWDWPANSPPDAMEQISRRRPSAGFALVAEVIHSRVERREISIYDLDTDLVGRFDFVYIGSLLLHLRDPVGALMKVRGVCDGRLLLVDAIDESPVLDGCRRPALTGGDDRGGGSPIWPDWSEWSRPPASLRWHPFAVSGSPLATRRGGPRSRLELCSTATPGKPQSLRVLGTRTVS